MKPKKLHRKVPKAPKSPEHWTERRVFAALKGPFPDGAFLRIPQVRNGTGYSRRARTADALIVSCWPSRGIWFAGVEIKVSLHDWKKELAQPEKSAEIQKWCDYWYIAAPAGVVPLPELPPTWGLIECSSRGCKIVKAAPKLDSQTVSVSFVAAVLRSATAGMVPNADLEALVNEAVEKRSDYARGEYERLRDRVTEFEKLTGISVWSTWEYGNVKQVLKLVQQAKGNGLEQARGYLRREAHRLAKLSCEVLALCDSDPPDPGPPSFIEDDPAWEDDA